MKKVFISLFLILSVCFISGCNEREKYAVKILRDDTEVAKAALTGQIDTTEALTTVANASDKAANTLDPNRMVQPDTTSTAIVEAQKMTPPGQPNPELKKVVDAATKGPDKGAFGSLGWSSILGGGLLLVGAVGKFLGPPWNIAGSLLQGVASRCLPNYDRNKAAAVGAIVSVDKALTDYGALLDLDPTLKANLKTKLGGADPVQWFRDKLNATQQDMGTQSAVASVIDVLKQEVTTNNGVLNPSVAELDSFLTKHI